MAMGKESRSGPLTDAVITAMARLVDDGQSEVKRQPTHSELDHEFRRANVQAGDPNREGKPVGKAKRVRGALSWALENNRAAGEHLVYLLISMLRAKGGFRPLSENYVGEEAILDARRVFRDEGFDLSPDGSLTRLLLDNLTGPELTAALRNYIRRAQSGVAGTGKDLVEVTAKHILVERFGDVGGTPHFPTLLGQAFVAVGLAHEWKPGQPAHQRVEAATYELACAVNMLRNQEGTGHGRPFLPSVTPAQARTAIESMGVVAEQLLNALANGR